MSKGRKILLGILATVVLGFVGLLVLWSAAISVGYLNLAMSYSGISGEAELAMTYPLEPDQKVMVTQQGGKLVPGHGRIFITRKADGDRFVTFDRGGGHLGQQGYIYAPSAEDDEQVHQDAFGGWASREVGHLIGGWWYYDSTED